MAIEDNPETRARFGEWLQKRRVAAGLTQEELSQRVIMSRTHIAHIEGGRRTPSLDDARRLDQELDTGGVFEMFLPSLDGRSVAKHFEEAARFEAEAVMIRQYAAELIPGLLQTEGYASEILRTSFPPKSEEEHNKLLATRVRRSELLNGDGAPIMWALLGEATLRRPIGNPSIMAEQLRHIVHLSEERRARVHVLPFRVGAHTLIEGSVKLMWFEGLPPVAYLEGVNSGRMWDDPTMVQLCQAAYDQAMSDALPLGDSLDLIRAAAEAYENGTS